MRKWYWFKFVREFVDSIPGSCTRLVVSARTKVKAEKALEHIASTWSYGEDGNFKSLCRETYGPYYSEQEAQESCVDLDEPIVIDKAGNLM